MPSADNLLNKYRLERLLGEGAAGKVYLATHLALKAPRALKVLRWDTPGLGRREYDEIQARFHVEAQLGELIDHPSVVRVYDFERAGDTLILVMEYCPGGSLAERLAKAREAQQPVPIEECLRIAQDMAQGLAAIHRLGLGTDEAEEGVSHNPPASPGWRVVHRDLKPTNILFDRHGHAKVADLGIVQLPEEAHKRDLLTEYEPHPGTPAYKSPEQKSKHDPLTPASDVYALGLILFEMLGGVGYKPGPHTPSLRSLRAEVPEWLEMLVARMLAKDPEVRPWDGTAVVEALRSGVLTPNLRGERIGDKGKMQEGSAIPLPLPPAPSPLSPTPSLAGLLVELAPGVTLELVRVPAGEFLIGSDKAQDRDAQGDELPQHRLYLPEYLIGKYPVTVRQFAAFVRATGYKSPAVIEAPGAGDPPVTRVTWADAAAFCRWAGQVSGYRLRLPGEAEWEKAARGTDGLVYPWGDVWDPAKCNTREGGPGTTTPVGQYSPQGNSPYICADMAGNVWEWCLDWFDESIYKTRAKKVVQDPIGPPKGEMRVVRGGSWRDDRSDARCATRIRSDPDDFDMLLGFRVVLSPIHEFDS